MISTEQGPEVEVGHLCYTDDDDRFDSSVSPGDRALRDKEHSSIQKCVSFKWTGASKPLCDSRQK